ncbi:thiamine-monophosphate kinase, partial [Candidatus Dependentiae bacterium]|nr:thiamine-monophosphate kinase [Candidatus Dependentiae bacterium]
MNELSIIKYISKLKSAQVGGNIFFQKSCADNKTRGSYGIGDDCADNKTKGSYGIGDDCADNKTRGSYGIGDDCADNKTRGSYGIGDDCAVIPFSKQESILVTTDSLIENVHFNLEWISLYELGCKSVLVNISDILSCGGVPEYLFLSINVPKRLNKLEKLFNGIDFVCRKYGIKILGGDTTSSKNDLCITVTLMGKVKNENILYRHFSRPGELICVTGFVGLSGTGFYVLKDKLNKNQYKESVRHHLVPGILSLKDAKILSENAGSSMDNSDGLYSSLWYMLEKNNNVCII